MAGSSLGSYLSGATSKQPHGLHIIRTPDTAAVGRSVKNKIDAHLRNLHGVKANDYVSSEELDEYACFKDGTMINELRERVRRKHVYYMSDPHGDHNSNRLLKRKLSELVSTNSQNGNVDWESIIDEFGSMINDSRSINDKLIHDISMLEAIQSNGAESTNLVMAAMAYARQDKPTDGKREPHTLKLLGEWISNLTAHNGYVIDIDFHNPALEGAFQSTRFINLYTGWFVEECIRKMDVDLKNLKLSGADQGGDKKILGIAKSKELSHITVIKSRDYSKKNSVSEIKFIGDIADKDILIHDDIADSCGTLCTLLKIMLEKKPRSIHIAITHGMFHGEAYELLNEIINNSNGVIKKVYTTNSIYKEELPSYIEQIDMSNIIKNTILGIHTGQGIDRDDNNDYL